MTYMYMMLNYNMCVHVHVYVVYLEAQTGMMGTYMQYSVVDIAGLEIFMNAAPLDL